MLSIRSLKYLVVLALALSAGCASRSTNLVTRSNGAPVPVPLGKIALMVRPEPTTRERILSVQLETELKLRGMTIVPQSESEYTVAVGIEENRYVKTEPEQIHSTDPIGPHRLPFESPPWPVRTTTQHSTAEVTLRTEGIRLRVYRTADVKAGNFRTAWDGFFLGGSTVRPEEQPFMIRTLCDHVGRDFIGHIDFPK